ncbi:NAD(P)/FAD-dependent oxidoreductase [Halococcoides cellulosivorans]|uniref:FAD-dependent oxidoreductase n=1 Tax=Halococcoides cellulosivorans TaxID=1679096 RepID=A0A2R4WZM6_9EURY|nr:FAD-dependent oxidoreductase [Halococcoides cellulosivorans]AWB27003.1 FAD-dependent oxidoreductase [Halococcoides cellulosivorans]
MDRVCIVGAGIAGAGVAQAIGDAASVDVFEAANVGGRMASLERAGCRIDTGASYLEVDDDQRSLIERATTDLREIDAPIWQFDAAGDLSEGPNQPPRYSTPDGIDRIVADLFADAGATVTDHCPVERIGRSAGCWRVETREGTHDAEQLVLATPATATRSLLRSADWTADFRTYLADLADSIPYRTMDTVALHYPFAIDRPYFGLVSLESVYDVAWIAREGCKRGHVPSGEAVLVVQFGPAWATTHHTIRPDEAARAAADRAADLLDDEELFEFDWFEYQRWGSAIPGRGPGDSLLDRAAEFDLALAGDWVTGIGRTRAALESGLATGRRISNRL